VALEEVGVLLVYVTEIERLGWIALEAGSDYSFFSLTLPDVAVSSGT
jgi:hypothetical protein